MSELASTSPERPGWLTGTAWRSLFRDRPIVPLV